MQITRTVVVECIREMTKDCRAVDPWTHQTSPLAMTPLESLSRLQDGEERGMDYIGKLCSVSNALILNTNTFAILFLSDNISSGDFPDHSITYL